MGDLNASEESFYSGVYNRIIYIIGKLFKNARLNSHLLHIQVIQSWVTLHVSYSWEICSPFVQNFVHGFILQQNPAQTQMQKNSSLD